MKIIIFTPESQLLRPGAKQLMDRPGGLGPLGSSVKPKTIKASHLFSFHILLDYQSSKWYETHWKDSKHEVMSSNILCIMHLSITESCELFFSVVWVLEKNGVFPPKHLQFKIIEIYYHI